MSLIPWLLLALICLEHLIFVPALIKRSGGTAWHGYVPVLNSLAILKLNGRPWYWVIFLLFPGINLIMLTIMHVELGIVFGKRSTKEQLIMGALPWLGLAQLAMSDEEYVGPRVWKKKSTVREWGEAILWAIIVASVVRTYTFETFTIPTGSMEGSMLVGDYLYVNKITYGPKVPQTPFTVPFIHNVLPRTLTKSYTSWFSLPYTRLPGIRKVERYDAVVFSFPPGDTAITSVSLVGHNYYEKLRNLAIEEAGRSVSTYSENPEKYLRKARYKLSKSPGLQARPLDKKENYVKRCVGLPGDSLSVVNRQLHINGKAIENPEHLQHEYKVVILNQGKILKIRSLLDLTDLDFIIQTDRSGRKNLYMEQTPDGYATIIYLTKNEKEILEESGLSLSVVVMEKDRYKGGLHMFPNTNLEEFKEWTPDNLGPIYIPEAGRTIELNQRNIDMYSRVISFFEGHDLDISEEGVRIDGELTKTYTFEQDYYWMMGDNRHNSADSRMWGFIPEDHVIGCASFTWFSKQNMAQHGESKIRWNRMFKSVK
jgi:signal peptidase I